MVVQELHCGSRRTHVKQGISRSLKRTSVKFSSSVEFSLLSPFSLCLSYQISFNLPHPVERFLLASTYTKRNATSSVRSLAVFFQIYSIFYYVTSFDDLSVGTMFGLRGNSRKLERIT